MILIVDPEIEGFIPPLTEREAAALEKSLVREGRATDPLTVWAAPDGLEILLDGHNRYRLCRQHKLPFEVRFVHLPDRAAAKTWMLEHQRGRRNLTPDQNLMLNLRQGLDVKAFSAMKAGKAREVFECAPDLAAEVVAGKGGIESASNALKLRTEGAPTIAKKPFSKGKIHFVIGDTQAKEGVPTSHLRWIGQYLVDQFNGQDLDVIHLGDHWDMPSLSSFDQGKKSAENRRYKIDIDAGNKAFDILNEPLAKFNAPRKQKWKPRLHFLMGNHEDRIVRACEDAAWLDGTLSLEDLNVKSHGWKTYPFREPVKIDGISYAHYFYQQNTGKPFSGASLHARLKTIGHSFTQGHTQGFDYTERCVDGGFQHGLVLGSSYLHDEDYKGPQGNAHWRGIVVCHQASNGSYDLMKVSLEYLCRRYEGVSVGEFLKRKEAA